AGEPVDVADAPCSVFPHGVVSGAVSPREPAEAPGADPVGALAGAATVEPGAFVRSLRQYRHLIASSWISSAQYGHFFPICPPVRQPWTAVARKLTRPASADLTLG